MKKRNVRKSGKIILGVFIFMLILTITAQASIKINSQRLVLSGTSGSAYYHRVEGQRVVVNLREYLYSGIRRKGGAYVYGNPVGGDKVKLTAVSPTMTGTLQNLEGGHKIELH